MAKKISRFGSVVRLKCPKCRETDLFVNKNPYNFNEMAKMYKTCSVCGQHFEPETGFYYGAMYLSYAIGVFSSLILFSVFNFVLGISTTWAFVMVAVIWIGISPYLFRFSRSLWLNLYVNNHRDL